MTDSCTSAKIGDYRKYFRSADALLELHIKV